MTKKQMRTRLTRKQVVEALRKAVYYNHSSRVNLCGASMLILYFADAFGTDLEDFTREVVRGRAS